MSRWKPDARGRLARAAIELFTEQGFAATTVPQIAARAGLTTRTFFRHFADKREVLFAGDEELPALVARLVADAPAALGPLPVIAYGLEAVAATWPAGQRAYLRARRAVIRADAGLRERELRKLAVLADAIDLGFRERGVDALTATLAAQVAVAVFGVALDRWLDHDGERPLAEFARDTLRALRAVAAAPAEEPHRTAPRAPTTPVPSQQS
jgi:AcrR family transcriptional regulator